MTQHPIAPSIPPSFRSDDNQRTLETQGWVVVDLLPPGDVAELGTFFATAAHRTASDAYDDTYAEFSVIHSRPLFRRAAFERITKAAMPHLEPLLTDHRPLVANFVNKPCGTGVVPMHQNWSVVDEARFRSLSVWIALTDVGPDDGAMELVAGSHQRSREPRGMWAYEAFRDVDPSAAQSHLESVPVKAGQAIILDDATIHYSAPNLGDRPRLAIQLIVVPCAAQPLFFQQVAATDDGLEVDVWAVEERFFWDFWHGQGDAAFGTVVERRTVAHPKHHLVAGAETALSRDQTGSRRRRRWMRWRRSSSSRGNTATS